MPALIVTFKGAVARFSVPWKPDDCHEAALKDGSAAAAPARKALDALSLC